VNSTPDLIVRGDMRLRPEKDWVKRGETIAKVVANSSPRSTAVFQPALREAVRKHSTVKRRARDDRRVSYVLSLIQ